MALEVEGGVHGGGERGEAGGDVGAEVDAEGAAAALDQDLEVAARLRRLDDAEGVFLTGHGQVVGVVAGDLQEDARVRTALVGLTRRMQKARPELEAGGDALHLQDAPANGGEGPLVRLVHLDVPEQREVVGGPQAAEMPDIPEPAVGILEAVIRDERGVRLAKEQDD